MFKLLRLHDARMTVEQEVAHIWTPLLTGKIPVFGEIPAATSPLIQVTDDPDQFRVTAEFSDIQEKDLQVHVRREGLLISVSSGDFIRLIPIPENANRLKAAATFKEGVLQVIFPKQAPLGISDGSDNN